ncbi:MAG: hypothetical protein F6K48_02150 [Okeania sp. SIO3H1]|nr:hypothetical protein [Okeania sp. SIO3H1]
MALLKRVYDINLNSLGVNPPLTPPRRGSQPTPNPSQEGKSGVRREEIRRKSSIALQELGADIFQS